MADEREDVREQSAGDAPGGDFKTLRRLPQFEANLAAAKLEAAGIPCFIADQNISVAHPLLFTTVRLQVSEADLQRAEEILAAPTEAQDDERDEAEEDGGYVEEDYRCPRCRRKAVDLVPVSGAMKAARVGCLGVLFLPLILSLIAWLIPETAGIDRDYEPELIWLWLITVCVLTFVVIAVKRTKRCRECGHEWGSEPA